MGKLVLIATPIGNLGDISPRAVEALESADIVAAEDTRHSGTLLKHLGIKKPMTSYYQHNEKAKEGELLTALDLGKTVALVSDAGTPAISDPGYAIAVAAIEAGHEVDAIPGACALIQALVLSGLPTDKFAFEGFLPRNKEGLVYLKAIADEKRTLIFYEAPHRFKQTLSYLQETFGGERKAAVCRELTKKFQEVNRATLAELNAMWQEREPQGEYVLVVAGAEEKPKELYSEDFLTSELSRLMAGGMKHKAASRELAMRYDLPVSEIYDLGLKMKKS